MRTPLKTNTSKMQVQYFVSILIQKTSKEFVLLFVSMMRSLSRRLLHRNGTFGPPAQLIFTRRRLKTDFRRKTGRSQAVYESIQKVQRLK